MPPTLKGPEALTGHRPGTATKATPRTTARTLWQPEDAGRRVGIAGKCAVKLLFLDSVRVKGVILSYHQRDPLRVLEGFRATGVRVFCALTSDS